MTQDVTRAQEETEEQNCGVKKAPGQAGTVVSTSVSLLVTQGKHTSS